MTTDIMKIMREGVRSLPQSEFDTLRLAVAHEHRRRRRIQRVNAGWTSGPGLEACLGASVKLSAAQSAEEEKPK